MAMALPTMSTSASAPEPSRQAFTYKGFRFFWLGTLTTSFADGLKKVYGNRAPALGAGASYGYIVD